MNKDLKSSKMGVISQVFSEAKAYRELADLEALVEGENSLAHIPVQPLFVAFQQAPLELISEVLPKLSLEQRQAISDLSLWEKDKLDIYNYSMWPEAYARCKDEKVIAEYAQSHDFLLFLKGRLGIHTFDVEDPQYPDHDYYFLTDDQQLLIEYDEAFDQIDEIKFFIKKLYENLGVENAYSLLFKYTVDTFSTMEENSYEQKKERLREFGFVDYYEALSFLGIFQSQKQIESFLKGKNFLTPHITQSQLNQALHQKSLMGFKHFNSLEDELSLVKNTKRLEYLRFHLLRFINGTLALNNGLKRGSVTISDTNKETERYVLLGYKFLQSKKQVKEESLFEVFDFFDCYKIGRSLIYIEKNKLKKALKESVFEQDHYFKFLGDRLVSFIERSFSEKFIFHKLTDFFKWQDSMLTVVELLPYAQRFYQSFQELKGQDKIQDHFYYNYQVEEIDFESLLLSSLGNFVLGHYEKGQKTQKMGLSIQEFKSFMDTLDFTCEKPHQDLWEFIKRFGLDEVRGVEAYFINIMKDHLEGYDCLNMKEGDFKHIGGVIILSPEVK